MSPEHGQPGGVSWIRRALVPAYLVSAALTIIATVMTARGWGLYLGLGLGVMQLLLAGIYVRDIRRTLRERRLQHDPIVVLTSQQPGSVKSMPLSRLAHVDLTLVRAQQRESTLVAADIPDERWQRAVAAAGSPEQALEAFAESLGARLGSALHEVQLQPGAGAGAGKAEIPAAMVARSLLLPELRVRFARETAIAAVSGRALEDGAARALVEAMHQAGAGPRQALVLDLTEQQNAHRRLASMLQLQLVVLSSDALRDLILADEPMQCLEAVLVDQIAAAELSPYQTAGGVEQDSLFFGREPELRTMASQLGRSFVLVGSRQMGKSSLLKALRRRLDARMDVEVHYLTLSSGDITAEIQHHLAGEARPAPDIPASTAQRFRELVAGTRERPLLWLVDEADQFVVEDTAAGHPITRVMRQLTQDGLAYFVLTGFWELYAATTFGQQHPLLNFAEVIRLGPLDAQAATRLATEPMAALGLSWDSPDTVEHLVRGAGQRANLIVLACKGMIETLDRATDELTREHLDRVVRDPRLDLGRELHAALRRHESPLDRAIVYQALLLAQPTPERVRAALADHGLTASLADFERASERLFLSYLLVDDDLGQLRCPVPFLQEHIERKGALAEHLRDLAAQWAAERR